MSAPIVSDAEQVARIKAVLAHSVKLCGEDRAAVVASLLGALAAICTCSPDGEELFQIVQEDLAYVRTLCLAAPHSPAVPS